MTESSFQISSAAVSDKGLSEKRPQNEDSFLLLTESGLFAVADGVGGAQAGDVASEMAVEILEEAFINLNKDGDAEARMRAAIEQANSAIYQMSRDLPSLSTMATTLVAIHISENIATIGHVGDSRLYRLDKDGYLARETQDHSVVEEEVRAGRMTAEEAESHPNRNVINRALGAEETVEIDMKTIMFEPRTTFLVCTDGVTRHIPDPELRELLSREGELSNICDEIKRICYERGAEDNLTAVLVRVEGEEATADAPFELDDEGDLLTVASARAGATTAPLTGPGDVPADPAARIDRGFELDEIEDLEVVGDVDAGLDPDEIEEPYSVQDEVEDPYSVQDAEEVEGLGDSPEIVIPTREDADSADITAGAEADAVQDVRSYRVDESSGSGIFGKILSGLVWLLVGVAIGALGYFMYSNTYGSPFGTANEQSSRALFDLEQKRRMVDVDPAKYIATYSTIEENTAGHHYLIGRAYLIQKNYGAAKTSFENALKFLDQTDAANRSVLEHDIAVGMAIANDEAAQKAFEGPKNEPQDEPGANVNAAPKESPQG